MPIVRQGKRFKAVLKSGREYVASKSFDTKRQAAEWLSRERAAMDGGVDPRAGQVTVKKLLPEWVELRRRTRAAKTAQTDAELLRLASPALKALAVGSVQPRHVSAWLAYLVEAEQSQGSVKRYRASLSSFFAWCVENKRILVNPVTGVRVPSATEPADEMNPYTEDELAEVVAQWRKREPSYADALLLAGWSGVRWGELRALRVSDVQEVPSRALLVRRSQTEGGLVKSPKSGVGRRVPLPDVVWPAVAGFRSGKAPADLLVTGPDGGQLWRGRVTRTLDWKNTARGRRIHDLRHTAACLWLARGVDVGIVKAWMGHASIATTNIYLHHLGTVADSAALSLLNKPRPGDPETSNRPGGTTGVLNRLNDEA